MLMHPTRVLGSLDGSRSVAASETPLNPPRRIMYIVAIVSYIRMVINRLPHNAFQGAEVPKPCTHLSPEA